MLGLKDYAQARALTDAQFAEVCRKAPERERDHLALLARHRRLARSPRALSAGLTEGRELQARHLDLIDQAVADLEAQRADRLLLTMPPRHGKSRRVRWNVLWYLMLHPDHRVMIASYGDGLAASHGAWLRDTIKQHGEVLGLRLPRRGAAASSWGIQGADGGVHCTGLGGGMTGLGAELLLVDDPVKDAEQAESPRYQERAWDWWTAVAQTRLEPAGGAVVIQTRWAVGDLAGRILADEREEWKHLDIPAMAMSEDEWRALDLEPRPDPLGREAGEALWPERFPLPVLQRFRKRVGERVWWSLYQQQPRPATGAVISRDDLVAQRVTKAAADAVDRRTAAVAIDPSGGGRDEAGIIGGWLGVDGRLYIAEDRSGVMPSEQWAREACLLAHELEADRFVVETNYGGDQTLLTVRTAWKALVEEGAVSGFCPRLVPVHSKKGKLLRAEPIAGQFREDRIRLVGSLRKLEFEWITWLPSAAKSPGRIDASVHLAYGLLPVPGKETVVSNPAQASQRVDRPIAGGRYGRHIGT
ncbi:terminase, large subunit [Streptomyces chilikensis]|uniref:Terminase, large subunit n=1 Tax=Streptomyces chilikensis TaxID=1194079 RepID=A0ABV3EJA6_9ACTN